MFRNANGIIGDISFLLRGFWQLFTYLTLLRKKVVLIAKRIIYNLNENYFFTHLNFLVSQYASIA
jgi:hypothetical protein